MSSKFQNIAVLIDADNTSAQFIAPILEKIETLGHIVCKKVYGDWRDEHIRGWQEALLMHAIEPMQHFAYVKGKNTTDIGMVIEAMDMLHEGIYDAFCLISSDSDFTALALRIRKSGTAVLGFGKQTTVRAFTQACDDFYYIESLTDTKSSTTSQPIDQKSLSTHAPVTPANTPAAPINPKRWDTEALQTQTSLINVLNKIIKQAPNATDGWIPLSYTVSQINQKYPYIKLKDYGYAKTSDLIRAIGLYDVQMVGKTTCMRLTTAETKTATTKPKSTPWQAQRLKCDTKLLNSLRKSIKDHPQADKQRWVNFGSVGQQMRIHYPEFSVAYYGYTKLIEIIDVIDLFETKKVASTLYVRTVSP